MQFLQRRLTDQYFEYEENTVYDYIIHSFEKITQRHLYFEVKLFLLPFQTFEENSSHYFFLFLQTMINDKRTLYNTCHAKRHPEESYFRNSRNHGEQNV